MSWLELTHHKQQHQADCLPMCVFMVLSYLGIGVRYGRLLRILKTDKEDGTPFFNIRLVESLKVLVMADYEYADPMGLLERYIEQGLPVIASVNTFELPYWNGESTEHAIVVAGIDSTSVAVHDPNQNNGPIVVDRDKFELAWLDHTYLYAVIQKTS